MAGRTQDPNYNKVLYVKKGKTALFYKRSNLTDPEQGIEVKEGNPVGRYLRTIVYNGVSAVSVSWPSDASNPVRYVNAALVDYIGIPVEPGKETPDIKTTLPAGYDPAKDPVNETKKTIDITWLLASALGVLLLVKFVLPKYK